MPNFSQKLKYIFNISITEDSSLDMELKDRHWIQTPVHQINNMNSWIQWIMVI